MRLRLNVCAAFRYRVAHGPVLGSTMTSEDVIPLAKQWGGIALGLVGGGVLSRIQKARDKREAAADKDKEDAAQLRRDAVQAQFHAMTLRVDQLTAMVHKLETLIHERAGALAKADAFGLDACEKRHIRIRADLRGMLGEVMGHNSKIAALTERADEGPK